MTVRAQQQTNGHSETSEPKRKGRQPVNRIAEALEATNGSNSAAKPDAKTGKKPTEKAVRLVVPALNVQVMEVTIKGIAPLVIRSWDEKTAQMLEDKAKGEKGAKARKNVVPIEAYNAARYTSAEGWDGMPAGAFKAALVDAVQCGDIPKTEFSMTLGKKTFFVLADGIDKVYGRDMIRIDGKPEMYKQMQRTSTGAPYMSYRPMYRKWSATLRIQYNASRIDAQGVLNLVALAGFFVGVGEHRPSAPESKTGTFGRWEIDTSRSNSNRRKSRS